MASQPNYDPRGNKDVGDISEPEYGSPINRIVEWIYDMVRWFRQRDPVAPGDPFTKFATMGRLVQLNVLTEKDVLGDDDQEEPDPDVAEPQYVVVHAREMYPSITNGASAVSTAQITSAKPNIQYISFPAGSDTSADFQLVMPFGWPGNAFQFRAYWSHPTGATAYTVDWKLQAHSATDQEAIGSDFADGGTTSDDGGATDALYITAESSAITISGINAKAGDLIFLRVTRLGLTGTSDDLDVAARLHAIRFNLGETPVEFEPVLDSDFSSVVLLLHGEGSDGSTTFIDDSGSAHSVSVSGAPTITTTNPHWESGAMLFTGSTGYLNAGTSTDWDFGSGDFTIEFFMGHMTWPGTAFETPIVSLWNTTTGLSWIVTVTILNRLSFFYYKAGVGNFGSYSATGISGLIGSSYKHFAITRSGSTLRIFIDGAIDYSGSITGTIDSAASTPLCVGGTNYVGNLYLDARLDGLRITKGVARYTADFSSAIPSVPFPRS